MKKITGFSLLLIVRYNSRCKSYLRLEERSWQTAGHPPVFQREELFLTIKEVGIFLWVAFRSHSPL